MAQEDIVKMARKAGIAKYGLGWTCWEGQLEAFTALVAAAEREACAELCEEHIGEDLYDMFGKHLAKQCAEAIRERGEQ
jgi:hypothetical protein